MLNKKEKQNFQPLDIVHKPVKSLEEIIECYFTDQIRLAHSAHFQLGKFCFESTMAEQCYYCNIFVSGKKRLQKHLIVCGKKPGITYKFNNEHLTTFEENFKLMGDLSFCIYFDLEATCGRKVYEDATDSAKNMYPVSYCFIVAFNPFFCLNKIIVLRNFNDPFEELGDVSYLLDDMVRHRDPVTTSQLSECVQKTVIKNRILFNRNVLL